MPTPYGSNTTGNLTDLTEQYIANSSFDKTLGVSMTELVGQDGQGNVYKVGVRADGTLGAPVTERYDLGNPYYVGSAPVGSATSSAVWTITKYDLSAGTGLIASGVAWDSRTGATYR